MKSSKSNINFELIEFEIAEKDLESFKKNIQQGCIKKVDQLALNKWHYLLKTEDKLLETEISYNKSNIKNFICACGARSPKKMCKHVQLLSYWHVKTILTKKDHSIIGRNREQLKLHNSTTEDLHYFINFLSRQNNFNKEWVQFFISARDSKNQDFNTYSSILTRFLEFIGSYTKNNASKLKYTLQLFDELYNISFYHYNQSNISNAVNSLLAGIYKMHNWYLLTEAKNKTRIQVINERYHVALERFISSIIAPTALTKVNKLIYDLLLMNEYQILSNKSNLFQIYKSINKKNELDKKVLNSLITKLATSIPDENKINILDFLFSLNESNISEFIGSCKSDNYPYWMLPWLEQHKSTMSLNTLVDFYNQIYLISSKEFRYAIALKIADLFASTKQKCDKSILIKYYLETGIEKLLEIYFSEEENDKNFINNFIQSLSENFSEIVLTTKQKMTIAMHSRQWDLLIKLLESSANLDDLSKYDSKFPSEYHPQLIAMYSILLKEYLDSFAGHKAKITLQSIFNNIKQIYSVSLQRNLKEKLKQHQPNRKFILNL